MITALYWIATVAAFTLCAFVIERLLRDLRESTQQWRSRVDLLERERDDLISQVAAARGVAAGGAPSTPYRTEWPDPETGNVYFSDGEVRDPHGNQLMPPGKLHFHKDYGDTEAQ